MPARWHVMQHDTKTSAIALCATLAYISARRRIIRAEIERTVEEIKQAVALLRRHL
jgi:hypothetical protein